jgi:threonine/homoserine/homoserine lactone efflux protein
MIHLKNIAVGFLVSFVGSIPLGYLNIVGYEIFTRFGIREAILYLLGVICIEFFVIYFTLLFANQLMNNRKLIKFIEGFSVVFMFVLAYIFYASSNALVSQESILKRYIDYSPYVVGLILSCLNFIQIPFWIGWNLYLLNGKHIDVSNSRKYFYVFGTTVGTFAGMLTLILSLHFLTGNSVFLAKYLMKVIIPIVFIGLGIFQGVKFYRKYFNTTS